MSAALTFKTQSNLFTTEVLPSLFHGSPGQFVYYLERDGNKLLRFYWDEAGKKLAEEQRASSFGLNYMTRPLPRNSEIILITLPEPCEESEAYYVALIYQPYRRLPFFGVSDISRVVVLERTYDPDCNPSTRLVDIDRHLGKEIIGPGPAPEREAFLAAVNELIRGT